MEGQRTSTPAARPGERPPPAAPLECPRCGSTVEPGQEYCLECGLRLPAGAGMPPGAGGRVRAGARESLVTILAALAVAVVAAAAVVAVQVTRDDSQSPLLTATTTPGQAVEQEPEPVETALPETPPAEEPEEPEPPPQQPPPRQQLVTWPEGTDGWTVILASMPTAGGRPAAVARAREARDAGLADVGVLLSSDFSSLHPGYFNVFSGVFSTQAEAEAAVPAARQAGFPDAYPRRITP